MIGLTHTDCHQTACCRSICATTSAEVKAVELPSFKTIPKPAEFATMTLGFPNPSRSFDEVRNAVRFIGHDGMFEVPFLCRDRSAREVGRQDATGRWKPGA